MARRSWDGSAGGWYGLYREGSASKRNKDKAGKQLVRKSDGERRGVKGKLIKKVLRGAILGVVVLQDGAQNDKGSSLAKPKRGG
jgi:hypothetical protein